MDCRVVVEAAVPVYDVANSDEAVRIAISKTGEMLNPDLNYVEIDMGDRSCPHCGEPHDPAFVAADESLVALELEMTVFNVEREEHASRIARKEIGQRLENIPLDVLTVEVIEDDAGGESPDPESSGDQSETPDIPTEVAPEHESGGDADRASDESEPTEPDTDDELPAFEDIIAEDP